MIATISAQPIRMTHHHQHLYSNAAGGPLPTIPRRSSSSRPSSSLPVKRVPKSPGIHRMKRSVSSGSDSDAYSAQSAQSSSPVLGAPLSLRARRARGSNPPAFPEALSTTPLAPISVPPRDSSDAQGFGGLRASKTEDNITVSEKRASRPMIYVPGMSLRSNGQSTTERSTSVPPHPSDDSRPIRKKSGQLVKPSLKTSRSAGADGFSGFGGPWKSEPATPVCKSVHFDSQLEQVKLFLAEQKPLAVSRDGSPTDDTSGTDSDFPSFIFGDSEEQRRRQKLDIDVVNMLPRFDSHSEVVLERLSISSDNSSIIGTVQVRNLAYTKLVAIRFTFDSWQTTSEVTARYMESLNAEFDRFTFTIGLTDMLARIEEKTLILAVRYSVAGQDFWDNNDTRNYVAKFIKSVKDRSLSDEEDSSSNLHSLQNKLEKVVQGKERTGPAFLAQSAKPSVEPEPEAPAFKSTSSFASRYDFTTSLKNPWKYQENQPTHIRHNSFPQFGKPSSPPSNPLFPLKPVKKATTSLGSPRDLLEGAIPITPASSHDETPFIVTPRPDTHVRNHRRGYFDLSTFNATNVKRTPPTSPPTISIPDCTADDILNMAFTESPKLYAFPSTEPTKTTPPPLLGLPMGLGIQSLGATPFGLSPDSGFDSEISTPSLATPSSSRETTPSPTERFTELPSGSDSDTSPHSSDSHYRELINQYCFFTGSEPTANADKTGKNAASKEGLHDFASSTLYNAGTENKNNESVITPRSAAQSVMFSPQRSSSADDVVILRSPSLTPTGSRADFRLLSESESRSATPVPLVP